MYDLHTHSNYSDGSLSPQELIGEAHARGLSLFAITDHNTVSGQTEAAEYAKSIGQPYICGVEMEADHEEELHLLGLGVNPNAKSLTGLFDGMRRARDERNTRLSELLKKNGMDVSDALQGGLDCTNRAHYAMALVRMGYASSVNDAFMRLLGRGAPYYVESAKYPSIEETMQAIQDAGGVAVFAHPMNMHNGVEELTDRLCALGLWGIEVYYRHSTAEQIDRFAALAVKHGLFMTCGSDFHGEARPEVHIACSWRDEKCLCETETKLKNMFNISTK